MSELHSSNLQVLHAPSVYDVTKADARKPLATRQLVYIKACADEEFDRKNAEIERLTAELAEADYQRRAALKREVAALPMVVAERDRLRAALAEAMEWNWLDEESPPPLEVRGQCEQALHGVPLPPRVTDETSA